MVRRCNGNRVELFILERRSNILKAFRIVATFFADFLAARFEQAAVGINQVRDLNVLEAKILIDVSASLSMNACDPNTDHVVGTQHATG